MAVQNNLVRNTLFERNARNADHIRINIRKMSSAFRAEMMNSEGQILQLKFVEPMLLTN